MVNEILVERSANEVQSLLLYAFNALIHRGCTYKVEGGYSKCTRRPISTWHKTGGIGSKQISAFGSGIGWPSLMALEDN